METSLLEDKSEQKEDRGGEALHVGPGGGRGTSEDAGMRRAGDSQDERLRDEGFQERAWRGQWAVQGIGGGCPVQRQLDLSEQAGWEENAEQGQDPDPSTG